MIALWIIVNVREIPDTIGVGGGAAAAVEHCTVKSKPIHKLRGASTAGAMIAQRKLMLVTIAAVGNDVIITSKCGVRLNSVLRIRRAHCLDHNKWGEGN